MKASFLLLYMILFFIGITKSSAQINFDHISFEDFKLPDIDRQALDISGSFNGNYSDSHQNFLDDHEQQSLISPDLRFSYSWFINRKDLQFTWNASTFQNLELSRSNSTIFTRESSRKYEPILQFSAVKRKYRSQAFFETGGSTFISLLSQRDLQFTTNNSDKLKDNRIIANISASVGFGKGRIEPVSDLAMALFVLSDATDLGVDATSMTQENIFAFASLMAEVRNKRIFDDRRNRIQQLRDLYSFMLDKNWVVQNDPGFFTVLTDNWIENLFFSRFTGKRWRFILSPQLAYQKEAAKTGSFPLFNSRSTDIGSELLVEFRKETPVNLHKGRWRFHELHLDVTSRHELANNFEPFIDVSSFLEIAFKNGWGKNWFPTNRSSILADITMDYFLRHVFTQDRFGPSIDLHRLTPALNGQFNYLLSWKTRLNMSASLDYNLSNGENSFTNGNGQLINSTINGFNAKIFASILVSLF